MARISQGSRLRADFSLRCSANGASVSKMGLDGKECGVACACDFLCKSHGYDRDFIVVAQGDPLDDLFVCGDDLD